MMQFKPNKNLESYDVYPKVFAIGKTATIHIRQLGSKTGRNVDGRLPEFIPGQEYKLMIAALEGGRDNEWPISADMPVQPIVCDENGNFTFEHTFTAEGQYFLRFMDAEDRRINQFPVFCVDTDLVGRYPFRGDLHLHSCRSDGRQEPEIVCANYRRHGYDFLAITDHERYFPSLDALRFYKDVPIELNILPGEEVHPQPVDGMREPVHIVNFGGEYSVNAMVEGVATNSRGTDPSVRSLYGECPPVMTKEEYDELMKKLIAESDVPEGIEPFPAVCCKWVFDEIHKANGLGIFCHPRWISNMVNVPERFTDYLMDTKPFDAFEVLGGELYYEQNGFQALRYYEDRAKGRNYPVVGSTDSHNSYESYEEALICSTIVFSPENERKALIQSIKDYYSIAVDTISEEFRLVGDYRLGRYACFLLKEYFPLHDELCIEEGRLMKQYATGTPDEKADALRVLEVLCGRVKKQREKYFCF